LNVFPPLEAPGGKAVLTNIRFRANARSTWRNEYEPCSPHLSGA
jgi:hypothetical protein